MRVEGLGIEDIQVAIEQVKAEWEAGVTPFTEMTSEECDLLLDYVPGPGDPTFEEMEQIAQANLEAFIAASPKAAAYPNSFDLRNDKGRNWITKVKDQGACGSGIAFTVCATVEGTFKKQRNNPNLDVDLSVAHLFYCHARSEGRRCNNSWWPSKALDTFRDKGVVDEKCYPYTAGDQNCTNLCSDWNNRIIKITGWRRLKSTTEMKEWISKKGPLEACFILYADFLVYKSGIYRHVSGSRIGGVCICVVGYNDTEKYWICKTSWGTKFGESGFFRIAYGQCGIDSFMDTIEGIEETGWERNKQIIGLWTVNQNRNAWVYVQGLGWRKISPDKNNIFFDMLAQLIAAKTCKRPVTFYQKRGIIKQIYVL